MRQHLGHTHTSGQPNLTQPEVRQVHKYRHVNHFRPSDAESPSIRAANRQHLIPQETAIEVRLQNGAVGCRAMTIILRVADSQVAKVQTLLTRALGQI